MALNDVKAKYRGSILGPYWVVLNLLILVSFLSVIYSSVFSLNVDVYVPYVSLGFIFWFFISGTVTEVSKSLLDNTGLIKNFNYPVAVYVNRVIARNIILLFHNLTVFVGVIFVFDLNVKIVALLFVPALLLNIVILFCFGLIFSILSSRFRDVPHVIDIIMQLGIFITPVIFFKDMVGSKRFIIDFNPFYHMIDVMRSPLLGKFPGDESWYFLLCFSVFLLIISAFIYRKFSNKVPYWI